MDGAFCFKLQQNAHRLPKVMKRQPKITTLLVICDEVIKSPNSNGPNCRSQNAAKNKLKPVSSKPYTWRAIGGRHWLCGTSNKPPANKNSALLAALSNKLGGGGQLLPELQT